MWPRLLGSRLAPRALEGRDTTGGLPTSSLPLACPHPLSRSEATPVASLAFFLLLLRCSAASVPNTLRSYHRELVYPAPSHSGGVNQGQERP